MDSTAAACWEGNAETWTRHARAGYDLYRDALNTPVFFANLPPISGLRGLDIGCGEGGNTRKLAESGAKMTAVDIAPTFIRHACEAEVEKPLGIIYRQGDGAALPFPDESFDFATAFMSLMDMPHQDRALAEAARVLKPGGFLQFSILHPCFAPPYRKVLREEDGTIRAIEVGRYFDGVDGEIETWRFGAAPAEVKASAQPFRVPRFHRTLSEWVALIVAAGLSIEHMGEPRVDAATAEAQPYLADTHIAPLFLHIRARKPG
ncbi:MULTISPECIES: class I SAM-dependent methyltransferase [unclassified Bosea (in: a-proteobacteria)]|uniref:class I SAM-dependent methyltransferase n=1 Tax=unclassified Bosea (in: a-proteobacteria) TaxID=2653178 RepID=UPI000954FDE5|nr:MULTISPECIES: class I SAM-dependent methyltransferase [unclassified Bosea (in: a-proteobacteria)]TAJ29615.1 MAG: class I SAM-dependent methyltransferase [Bosea sp. (in: a-proteobacteria)]SIQ04535.1 Methyltransferase domain-containing protein [Bosea sp. TND4EK4]